MLLGIGPEHTLGGRTPGVTCKRKPYTRPVVVVRLSDDEVPRWRPPSGSSSCRGGRPADAFGGASPPVSTRSGCGRLETRPASAPSAGRVEESSSQNVSVGTSAGQRQFDLSKAEDRHALLQQIKDTSVGRRQTGAAPRSPLMGVAKQQSQSSCPPSLLADVTHCVNLESKAPPRQRRCSQPPAFSTDDTKKQYATGWYTQERAREMISSKERDAAEKRKVQEEREKKRQEKLRQLENAYRVRVGPGGPSGGAKPSSQKPASTTPAVSTTKQPPASLSSTTPASELAKANVVRGSSPSFRPPARKPVATAKGAARPSSAGVSVPLGGGAGAAAAPVSKQWAPSKRRPNSAGAGLRAPSKRRSTSAGASSRRQTHDAWDDVMTNSESDNPRKTSDAGHYPRRGLVGIDDACSGAFASLSDGGEASDGAKRFQEPRLAAKIRSATLRRARSLLREAQRNQQSRFRIPEDAWAESFELPSESQTLSLPGERIDLRDVHFQQQPPRAHADIPEFQQPPPRSHADIPEDLGWTALDPTHWPPSWHAHHGFTDDIGIHAQSGYLEFACLQRWPMEARPSSYLTAAHRRQINEVVAEQRWRREATAEMPQVVPFSQAPAVRPPSRNGESCEPLGPTTPPSYENDLPEHYAQYQPLIRSLARPATSYADITDDEESVTQDMSYDDGFADQLATLVAQPQTPPTELPPMPAEPAALPAEAQRRPCAPSLPVEHVGPRISSSPKTPSSDRADREDTRYAEAARVHQMGPPTHTQQLPTHTQQYGDASLYASPRGANSKSFSDAQLPLTEHEDTEVAEGELASKADQWQPAAHALDVETQEDSERAATSDEESGATSAAVAAPSSDTGVFVGTTSGTLVEDPIYCEDVVASEIAAEGKPALPGGHSDKKVDTVDTSAVDSTEAEDKNDVAEEIISVVMNELIEDSIQVAHSASGVIGAEPTLRHPTPIVPAHASVIAAIITEQDIKSENSDSAESERKTPPAPRRTIPENLGEELASDGKSSSSRSDESLGRDVGTEAASVKKDVAKPVDSSGAGEAVAAKRASAKESAPPRPPSPPPDMRSAPATSSGDSCSEHSGYRRPGPPLRGRWRPPPLEEAAQQRRRWRTCPLEEAAQQRRRWRPTPLDEETVQQRRNRDEAAEVITEDMMQMLLGEVWREIEPSVPTPPPSSSSPSSPSSPSRRGSTSPKAPAVGSVGQFAAQRERPLKAKDIEEKALKSSGRDVANKGFQGINISETLVEPFVGAVLHQLGITDEDSSVEMPLAPVSSWFPSVLEVMMSQEGVKPIKPVEVRLSEGAPRAAEASLSEERPSSRRHSSDKSRASDSLQQTDRGQERDMASWTQLLADALVEIAGEEVKAEPRVLGWRRPGYGEAPLSRFRAQQVAEGKAARPHQTWKTVKARLGEVTRFGCKSDGFGDTSSGNPITGNVDEGIDQLLEDEICADEASWLDIGTDVTQVKNQVVQMIFSDLIEETVGEIYKMWSDT